MDIPSGDEGRRLAERYAATLRSHLTGEDDRALQRAYRLGQRAGEKGLLPALAAAHHAVLAELAGAGDLMSRAAGFLQKALQGHEDSVRTQRQALRVSRETLEEEIAERRLLERVLQDSEARFRAIFHNAGIGICLLDRQGRIRESNAALQRMLGCEEGELHGQSIFSLTHPEDRETARRLFRELVAGKRGHYRLEKRFLRKDGAIIWARKIISGVYNTAGELEFAIDMIEDITDSKRKEMALRESESRFRQIADMAGEWIWEQDREGRYLYSSNAVTGILGYRPEEIIGKPYYDLFTPEDRKRIAPKAPEMLARVRPFHNITNRYQHKDGHVVYTESSGMPVLDPGGRVVKWRGVDHDITERKRFEDELRLRDRAIEASSVGIIITDARQPDNPIIYANSAFSAITGYPPEELLGKNPRFLQGPDTDRKAIEAIRRALKEGRDCHLTLKNYRKDGSPFWNELIISPVRDESGRITHWVGIQTDVTELRRLEEQRHEMAIARKIQMSLLPPEPLRMDNVHVAGFCQPALQVGGDYFDYFTIGDTVNLVVADVSGHSVGAAMIMVETRSTLRAESHRPERAGEPRGAAENLALLNDLLYADLNRAELFITMFYAQYQTASGTLRYANAGHNRPLLIHSGTRMELDAEGLILGVSKEVNFEEKSIVLERGDTLLLYTDGVTEAQNRNGEFFGTERLWDLFAAHAGKPPRDIIEAVVAELEHFCQSKTFQDDITLVVLQIV